MVTYRMPWGAHKGESIQDLPLDYLQWCRVHLRGISAPLKRAIEDECIRRTTPRPAPSLSPDSGESGVDGDPERAAGFTEGREVGRAEVIADIARWRVRCMRVLHPDRRSGDSTMFYLFVGLVDELGKFLDTDLSG